MVGFINSITLDWKIVQLGMLALLVMIASFYTSTLFGDSSASVYEQSLPRKDVKQEQPLAAANGSAKASCTFTNKVSLTYRTEPLRIPKMGININQGKKSWRGTVIRLISVCFVWYRHQLTIRYLLGGQLVGTMFGEAM